MVRPSERPFRAAAIVAWFIVAFEGVVTATDEAPAVSAGELAFRFLALALFLPAIIWLLGPGLLSRRARVKRVALFFVSIIGVFVSPELFYVVAAMLPLVLPQRRALTWLACANLFGIPWLVFVIAHDPRNAGVDPNLSLLATMSIAIFSHLGWQVFAFAIGAMAAAERDQRHETARLHRELVATQDLLADGVRLAHRLEISRELHDTLGHHLTVLHLQLELALRAPEAQSRTAIEEARALGKLLLAEVRGAASALRVHPGIDLRSALSKLAMGSPGSTEIMLAFEEGVRITQVEHAHAFFRCAQEAITNAHRHARARRVSIDVRESAAGIALAIRDDGQGATVVRFGNGLRGMRERIEALHGRLEIVTAEGSGFHVEAWLPVAGAA